MRKISLSVSGVDVDATSFETYYNPSYTLETFIRI